MKERFYRLIRDLHLYIGLFISPFVVAFAISVFYLVHVWMPKGQPPAVKQLVTDLPLPVNLSALSGRPLIDSLRPALDHAKVFGEVGFVQRHQNGNRLVIPVMVPGRSTTVTIDVAKREASVESRTTGLADAFIQLHKAPGPHLANIRMNWIYMRFWSWFADATVYALLFITVSGIYLWYFLRFERRVGLLLLASGAISFFAIVYELCH